jgi:hypothetical protein
LCQESKTAGYQPEDDEKTYDWTRRTGILLSELITDLSAPIKEWESFEAPGGDIGYFCDIDSSQDASCNVGSGCLRSIKEMFDELKACRQKLIELQDGCKKLTKGVSQSRIVQSLFHS